MTNHTSSTCRLWPDKPERCSWIVNIQRVFSCLSLLGCISVTVIILVLKKHHVVIQRLIISLAIAASLNCISLLLGDAHIIDDNSFCEFQGFFIQFTTIATLLWVLVISINCLLIVQGKSYKKYYYLYQGVVWFVSFFWSLIPFAGDFYGPAGIWCWIKREETAMRFGIYYIPLFIICIVMFGLYSYVIWFVLKATSNGGTAYSLDEELYNKSLRDELKPLLSYPLIFLVFSIPIFMYRIDDAVHPDEPPDYALAILSVIFTPSLGFFNALAFAIFNASVEELSCSKLKIGMKSWLFSKPTHVIHNNYEVEESGTPSSRRRGAERAVSPTVEINNGVVSYQGM